VRSLKETSFWGGKWLLITEFLTNFENWKVFKNLVKSYPFSDKEKLFFKSHKTDTCCRFHVMNIYHALQCFIHRLKIVFVPYPVTYSLDQDLGQTLDQLNYHPSFLFSLFIFHRQKKEAKYSHLNFKPFSAKTTNIYKMVLGTDLL